MPGGAHNVFLLWAALLHLRLPVFGGFWPLLDTSAGLFRQVAAYGTLPLREAEILGVAFLANTLRFASLGPVIIVAMATAHTLLGYDFAATALRASYLIILLWLAQPIVLTFRLAHLGKLRGCVTFCLLGLVVVLSLALGFWAIILLLDGSAPLAAWPVVLGAYVVLVLGAAWYCRRHARGRVDLVQ
jgi:hypothetical protein